jgi:hypothetical protein
MFKCYLDEYQVSKVNIICNYVREITRSNLENQVLLHDEVSFLL